MSEGTRILLAIEQRDHRAADLLLPSVYEFLLKVATQVPGASGAGPSAPNDGTRPSPEWHGPSCGCESSVALALVEPENLSSLRTTRSSSPLWPNRFRVDGFDAADGSLPIEHALRYAGIRH
jgi:hypothetical protein